ncbi:hypothetical protein P4O66_010452 [Electrophorus voltai]|uniref:Uncharacterized protein n=1 Tax=Electrophorus voltai TaxID=2609070 RepID=A0AAD8ZCK5_9TELE|nr:hypothetical protein P4O66_010452 [Electrophorus voltai]
MQQPDWSSIFRSSHVTPQLRSLHWLPLVARIRFKTLMFAYKAKNEPSPSYIRSMVKPRSVPGVLRTSSLARLEIENRDYFLSWLQDGGMNSHLKTLKQRFQAVYSP